MRAMARTCAGLTVVAMIGAAVYHSSDGPSASLRTNPDNPQGAHAATTVSARSPGEVSDLMREALLAGNPVRVEYRAGPDKELDREYWCRAMTDSDKAWALRQLIRAHKTTDRAFELEGSDQVEVEREMTNQFRIRAMVEAAMTLIEEGEAFVTKAPVNALQSDDKWHYWNMRMHTKEEGDLSLNVPIDLNRFPQVRDWRQREQEMNQFAETEAAYRWNSLDYTVRQQIVADGKAARERLAQINEEAKGLNAVPRDERTAEQIARSIALGKEMEACQKAVSRVPRRLDPDTLEWKF